MNVPVVDDEGSRRRLYPLQDANGSVIGLLTDTACSHEGEIEEDTFNAIRLWPADYKQCDTTAAQNDASSTSIR
ncbi:MAG: hypothetical protein ACKN9D_09270 [Actinomycetales bacterium]